MHTHTYIYGENVNFTKISQLRWQKNCVPKFEHCVSASACVLLKFSYFIEMAAPAHLQINRKIIR